ncbi:MAG: FeoA domain-containing protein, partial [Butyrivibrio sp.]|nr:FeoA domain-containing protein [Butyrivibrio sp.]
MTLNELTPGMSAHILSVGGEGALRQHFLDMGVIPGVDITMVKHAPMGDPVQFFLQGYELTLRVKDAADIEIEPLPEGQLPAPVCSGIDPRADYTVHPGLGEAHGHLHPEGNADPLPDGTKLTFALVGNQNSGKTTLFNTVTGANQHVGNFPGVTVERKDGVIRGYPDTRITDLPGIYSMSPYSREELLSRNFVLGEKPHA